MESKVEVVFRMEVREAIKRRMDRIELERLSWDLRSEEVVRRCKEDIRNLIENL